MVSFGHFHRARAKQTRRHSSTKPSAVAYRPLAYNCITYISCTERAHTYTHIPIPVPHAAQVKTTAHRHIHTQPLASHKREPQSAACALEICAPHQPSDRFWTRAHAESGAFDFESLNSPHTVSKRARQNVTHARPLLQLGAQHKEHCCVAPLY